MRSAFGHEERIHKFPTARRERWRMPSWVSKPSSPVDDDAIDVDLVRGGHGEDLVGLHDLVVLGKVEEGAGDAPCQRRRGSPCADDLLVVDAEDEEVVAELLADGL